MKLTCFLHFGFGFKIKASVVHEHVMNNQEHVKNDMNNIQAYQEI